MLGLAGSGAAQVKVLSRLHGTFDISHTRRASLTQVPNSGKLSREKTFTNFTVLCLFVKVFSVKFGGVVSFGTAQASNQQKCSPPKSYFSPIFSLRSLQLVDLLSAVLSQLASHAPLASSPGSYWQTHSVSCTGSRMVPSCEH